MSLASSCLNFAIMQRQGSASMLGHLQKYIIMAFLLPIKLLQEQQSLYYFDDIPDWT